MNASKGRQVTELDLLLRQPSFQWRSVGLSDLRCFSRTHAAEPVCGEGLVPASLADMAEVIRSSAEAASHSAVGIYRYDANGYSIDAL